MVVIPHDEFDKLLLERYKVVLKGKPSHFFENDASDAYFYCLSLISNKYLEYKYGDDFINKAWNETDKIVQELMISEE